MKARRQRCTARVSDGSRQCERWAINGSTVCATHGESGRYLFTAPTGHDGSVKRVWRSRRVMAEAVGFAVQEGAGSSL